MTRSATLSVSLAVTLVLTCPQRATTFTTGAPRRGGAVGGAGLTGPGRLGAANDFLCSSRAASPTVLQAVKTIEKENRKVRDWSGVVADAAYEYSDTAHDEDEDARWVVTRASGGGGGRGDNANRQNGVFVVSMGRRPLTRPPPPAPLRSLPSAYCVAPPSAPLRARHARLPPPLRAILSSSQILPCHPTFVLPRSRPAHLAATRTGGGSGG